MRPPQGRREATVRFSRHPRQGKNLMSPHSHRKAAVRWGCGVAVSEKKFNVKLRKNARLAMTLRRAKNREVAARFA